MPLHLLYSRESPPTPKRAPTPHFWLNFLYRVKIYSNERPPSRYGLVPSLVPRPFCVSFRGGRGGRAEGRRKGLVNNLALARIHGSIPAVSVDEGKNTNLE